MKKAAKADSLGGRMQLARQCKGLTQAKVAEYLHIDTDTYGNYERNRREPGIATLSRFCDVVGISLDEVAGRHAEHSKSPLEELQATLLRSSMLCEQELARQRGRAR